MPGLSVKERNTMVMMPGIPKYLQDEVKQRVAKGEIIRWVEQPIPRFFTAASTKMFLLAFPLIALLVYDIVMHRTSVFLPDSGKFGPGIFTLLFDVPFIVIGIGLLLSPLWTRWVLKTVYIITDQRALVFFDGGWTITVRSYTPNQLKGMYCREKKDGTGDVVLGGRISLWSSNSGRQMVKIGFLRVRDVRKTEQMLRELTGQSVSTAP
jgi:hypothetical protein